MSKKDPDTEISTLLPLGIKFQYDKKSVETKNTLEFDPQKIKPGEAKIIEVKKWWGLSSRSYAVLNVDGKKIMVAELQ